MVTFKRGWGKLYYTQHTLLSNMRQLLFFFFFLRNKHTHTMKRERDIGDFLNVFELVYDYEGFV